VPADIHTTALRLLAHRALSARELEGKLADRGFSRRQVLAERVRLQEAGLLDDAAVAENVTRGVLRQGKGRRVVAATLRRRRVDRDELARVLAVLDPEAEEAALAVALERASQRHPGWRRLPQKRRRVIGYLLARGFPASTVRRVLAAREDRDGEVVEPQDS
jgi:regulatory protein